MIIPDGVLLMADGRLTRRDGVVMTDAADKIVSLLPSLFSVSAGIEQVTTPAIEHLKTLLTAEDTPYVITEKAVTAIERFWNPLIFDLQMQGHAGHPNNKVAMLIGGVGFDSTPFLIGLHLNEGERVQRSVYVGSEFLAILVIGDAGTGDLSGRIGAGLPIRQWIQGIRINPYVAFILRTMNGYLQEVSQATPTIGGMSQCVVLRVGFPPFLGQPPQ